MNPQVILEMLSELAMLRFFPSGNESVLLGLARLVNQMCRTEDEVRWLVDRMTSGIYAEWPGPQEMRACFCSRFPPKDRLNAYSTVYPDGIPLSRPLPKISAPPVRAFLTTPEQQPSPFELDRRARAKAQSEGVPHVPITQADIDRAVEEYRSRKAEGEAKRG